MTTTETVSPTTEEAALEAPVKKQLSFSTVLFEAIFAVTAIVLVGMVALIISGGATMTVLTGSMQPNINPGDVIINIPVDSKDLKVGDVISYQPATPLPGNMPNTHRVQDIETVNGQVTSLTTRGDNTPAADAPITPDMVVGKTAFVIPKLGYINVFLFRNNLPNLQQLAFGVIGIYGIYWLIAKMIKTVRRK